MFAVFRIGLFTCLALMISGSSWGIEKGDSSGYPVGGGYLYPFLGIETGYDDNIFLQKRDKKGSFYTIISPEARLEYNREITAVSAKLAAEAGSYSSSHNDDYLDVDLQLKASVSPSSRSTFSAQAGYQKSHDPRGTAAQVGDFTFLYDRPNRYHVTQVGGSFSYGLDAVGAPRFEISAKGEDRTYDNNRATTIERDRDSRLATATLFYKIMPVTSLLLEGRAITYDYDVADLDSTQTRLMGGVIWEATNLTEGFAKFGFGRKNFDSPDRKDQSSSSWEIGVNWKPLSYSLVTFTTSRDFDETETVGDFIDSRQVSLDWKHDWYSHLGTTVSLSHGKDDYANDPRKDDFFRAGIKLDYRLRPGMIIGAGVTHNKLDSNDDELSYRDNIFALQLGINM